MNSSQAEDRFAIRELVDSYHAAVNAHDWLFLAELFENDAIWEAPDPISLRFVGRDDISAGLKASVLRQELLVQACSGVVVRLTSPRTALVTSTLIELGRTNHPAETWLAVAFYEDEVRKGDAWRFARRVLRVRYVGPLDLTGPVTAVDGLQGLSTTQRP